jgi:hypothetical protein
MAKELLGDTLTVQEVARLFGYTSTRSLNYARKNGGLIEGVHWRRMGVNRVIYFAGPCQHKRDHAWDEHRAWLLEHFPEAIEGDAVPIAS